MASLEQSVVSLGTALCRCFPQVMKDLGETAGGQKQRHPFACDFGTGWPHGAGFEEHPIGASSAHRFDNRRQWTARDPYLPSHDNLSGGHHDFAAPMISTSHRFQFGKAPARWN